MGFNKSIIPLLAAALTAAVIIIVVMGIEQSNPEEFALGPVTTSVYAKIDGLPIHCTGVEDASNCIDTWDRQGRMPVALWFGNSQLHAVNQYQNGQTTAGKMLYPMLKEKGLELTVFSQPNVNLQEQYMLFEYLTARLPVKDFILSLVFDDFRETGIRGSLKGALTDPATLAHLQTTRIGRNILKYGETKTEAATDKSNKSQTLQDRSEKALNKWLSRHSKMYKARHDLRYKVFLGLYYFRNWIFHITPQTERKIIELNYRANMDALAALLDSAQSKGIDVYLYITPLRQDVAPPYVPDEYRRFKKDTAELAAAKHARFYNLETVVPANLWGSKKGAGGAELDFMHFQAGGHEILARKINAFFPPVETDVQP